MRTGSTRTRGSEGARAIGAREKWVAEKTLLDSHSTMTDVIDLLVREALPEDVVCSTEALSVLRQCYSGANVGGWADAKRGGGEREVRVQNPRDLDPQSSFGASGSAPARRESHPRGPLPCFVSWMYGHGVSERGKRVEGRLFADSVGFDSMPR